MSGFAGFRPAALKYLRALKRHNERAWFIEHRETYDQEVLGPLRDFVSEIDDRLARVAPEICGDAKRSVFRIYRDVRFSHDKRPYKTHAACWFFHRDSDPKVGRDGGGAGFYFHIEPGNSQTGGGLWMPGREVLTILRDAIAEDPAGFRRAADSPVMRRRFGGLDSERVLTRMPRGFSECARGREVAPLPVVHRRTHAHRRRGDPSRPRRARGEGLRAAGATGALAQFLARTRARRAALRKSELDRITGFAG